MALTSGERQSKSTVSSIQSRMGVVDTYSGKDALGLAAEGASAVLDIFAERQANKEEVAWKTDFKLKTRNTLTNYAREYYDDPDAFTNSVNTYRDSLTNSTPTRFKNYAKEYIGNLAFEYGDKIWQEAKNQQDLLILDNFLTNHSDFIANRNQAIMGYTAEEMQTYWTTSLLPEMSDAMADYEKLYNSYPAAIQQQLADEYGTPDSVDKNGNPVKGTFNKTLAIGFETQRLISLANSWVSQWLWKL
jgi:DNA-binding ferritin-like protein